MKKFCIEESPPSGVLTAYRERGNFLQRTEQFEKAIQAYDEALRWNINDVRSLLGRSLARAKTTHYTGALQDVARATELEPNNLTAKAIRAQTEYEKCASERALVFAHRGKSQRTFPPDFAECARHAEETANMVSNGEPPRSHVCLRRNCTNTVKLVRRNLTNAYIIRECSGKSASKMLTAALPLLQKEEIKRMSMEEEALNVPKRKNRMQPQPTHQVREMTRVEKQREKNISRLMASKYLQRMAHDKYFLMDLCKDERLMSANKQGSKQLQELAEKALADLENRQAVLRERRPLYAARAAEEAARARLKQTRKEHLSHAQKLHAIDAKRLVRAAEVMFEKRDTTKCLENAEFAMEQISRKPGNVLPGKEKFMQELYDIVANAFLDQKRVNDTKSESDREKRAYVLLGLTISREPSRDSILRVRPPAPPRDAKRRLRALERALTLHARPSERCYVLHELARLHLDTKQAQRAKFYASKCQSESRASAQRIWLLNATFLLARSHVMQNNRPEARASLLEGDAMANSFGHRDIGAFYETCANVSTEGEVASDLAMDLEKREKAMVSLMQDDDMRSAAELLFRRMSTIPAARRFSIMPGVKIDETAPATGAGRRVSIMPRAQAPVHVTSNKKQPLGFQDFDI